MSNTNSGLMPLKMFLEIAYKGQSVTSLQFQKSAKTGRQLVATPAGTLFVSKTFDKSKPAFVTTAGDDIKTASGQSLAGSLWLCNSSLVAGDTLEIA